MAHSSKIQIAQSTWNPFVGCSHKSAGCFNCYAERMACRLAAMGRFEYRSVIEGRRWTGTVSVNPLQTDAPLSWKHPRSIFVGSMSDVFHPAVPPYALYLVFRMAHRCPHHRFILVTKRPERLKTIIAQDLRGSQDDIFFEGIRLVLPQLSNMTLVVTVEQNRYVERLSRAAFYWPGPLVASLEPVLETVDLSPAPLLDGVLFGHENAGTRSRIPGPVATRSIIDFCSSTSTPLFLKQLWQNGKLTKSPIFEGKSFSRLPIALLPGPISPRHLSTLPVIRSATWTGSKNLNSSDLCAPDMAAARRPPGGSEASVLSHQH